jgi:hypothetical protein
MSLSTMGLGRFMRDMFGEVQEPWLNASMKMAAAPVQPKENTISSTGGRQSQPTTPNELVSNGVVDDEGVFEPSAGNDAAKTLLQMPDPEAGDQDVDLDDDPAWNPRSYPSSQPSMASNQTLPPDAQVGYQHQSGAHRVPQGPHSSSMVPATMPGTAPAPTRPTPPPHVAVGTQPMPMGVPQGQFPAQHTPGSGSGPAHSAIPNTPSSGLAAPGVIASTKHGYASGASTRGDVSYPTYDPPADLVAAAADMQLKPNRRPLFIGLGVAIVGIIVMFVVLGGGSSENTAAPPPDEEGLNKVDKPDEEDKGDKKEAAPPPTEKGSAEVDDGMVAVIVESEPMGADVLIAGAKIGTTPLSTKVKRGTKLVQLTVHKDGYVDYTG